MLSRVTATEFHKAASSGKSRPLFIVCEKADGTTVETVAKFSAFCERGVTALAMEAIAACLAGDLGLPISEPFLVFVPQDWIDQIADDERRAKVSASSTVAFGSRVMTGQFSLWNSGTKLFDAELAVAAAIFAFDAIIQNPDRRAENPNCFVRGDDIRIFDHELAFSHDLVIGWSPPWKVGSLKPLETHGFHIFREALRGRDIDFNPIRAAWSGLSNARIAAYGAALPPEWAAAQPGVERALALIKEARDRIDDCISEVERVLK